MIWIATLCLLAIAVWLFFNALNERRWVEAHSHDETVASDKGFLPSFSAMTGSASASADGDLSSDQENTRFAKAVAKVKEKGSQYGDKIVEKKAAAARIIKPEDRPGSTGDENTLISRAVSKVGQGVNKLDERLDGKVKAAGAVVSSAAQNLSTTTEGSLVDRATRKVSAASGQISSRVGEFARNKASSLGEGRNTTDEGLFGKVAGKVSAGLETVEKRVTKSRTDSSVGNEHSSEDLITRVSSKVGEGIEKIDQKIVEKPVKTD